MMNIQQRQMSLMDIFVWCEALSLTSSLLTGLPFSNVDDIQLKWMEKKQLLRLSCAVNFASKEKVQTYQSESTEDSI